MLLNATLAILTIGLKQITKLSQRTGTRQTTYSLECWDIFHLFPHDASQEIAIDEKQLSFDWLRDE